MRRRNVDRREEVLNVLFRIILGLCGQPIRVMVRVTSVIGTRKLCDGFFEKIVIYFASRMWMFLLVHDVELVPIVASIAGVNNRVL
jgi:hypothetical protein